MFGEYIESNLEKNMIEDMGKLMKVSKIIDLSG